MSLYPAVSLFILQRRSVHGRARPQQDVHVKDLSAVEM
jgi:hypothetical protein